MSMRFAPITAALLIRNDTAGPTQESSSAAPADDTEHQQGSSPAPRECTDECGASPDETKHLVLNLTPDEYDLLGRAAVKQNTTRHELAQIAICAYFEWLVGEHGEPDRA